MTTPLHFSIRDTLRQSWDIFVRHPWLYIGLTAIKLLLSFPGVERQPHHDALMAFASLISVLFSYLFLSVILAAVDGKDDMLAWRNLPRHLPTLYQFLMLLEVSILVALAVASGVILLIIPGVYVLIRLLFAQIAYVDQSRHGKQNGTTALKRSWRLVSTDVFWKVFLTAAVALGLIVVGAVFFAVGFLVTYPLAMLLMVQLYRALMARYEQARVDVETSSTASLTQSILSDTMEQKSIDEN